MSHRPGTWTVFATDVDVTDPAAATLATLTANIPADVARTVVILDKAGGGVEVRAIENQCKRSIAPLRARPSRAYARRMRNTPAVARLLTLEEYLAFEEQSPLKHEYIAGEVFAMSGVTTRHNLITLNIVTALRAIARRRGCRVFATDVKLKAAKDRVYYPDLMVACGRAGEVELIVDEPSIVVEVTSRSTRAIDRREKLDAYQRVPSLRQYLIVEQRRRHVLSYSRDADGAWVREEFAENGEVPLRPLETELSLDAIYDDVPIPPLTVREGSEEDDDWEAWQAVVR